MNRPRTQRRMIGVAAIISVSLLVVGILLPAFAPPPNCGGNSAALSDCRNFVLEIRIWMHEMNGAAFVYEEADQETRRRLQLLGQDHWLGAARLLAQVNGVRVDSESPKTVIMACDMAFDNVPRRWFGKAPMRHAVAYSTGDVGLISPEEFQELDLNGFTDLRTLSGESFEPSDPPNDDPITPAENSDAFARGRHR